MYIDIYAKYIYSNSEHSQVFKALVRAVGEVLSKVSSSGLQSLSSILCGSRELCTIFKTGNKASLASGI